MNAFSRTELLFGTAAMERLAQARVAVFGIGGVGGYGTKRCRGVGLDRQRYRLHIESEPADHCHPCHHWHGKGGRCRRTDPAAVSGMPRDQASEILPAGNRRGL